MATTNVYLTFNGNCEAAFLFYKSVFEKEFTYIGRFKDIPQNDECEVAPKDADRIMHVSLPISSETVLMGKDSNTYGGDVKFGNNFAISIQTDSIEEAEMLFNKLSESGQVSMKLQKTYWDAWFAQFTDQFGIQWMINFDEKLM